MKLTDIQNEGIGDSLKTAGQAVSSLTGKGYSALGSGIKAAGSTVGKYAPTLGVLGTAFGRAVGFDASQGWAGKAQQGIAKQQFIGNFVQKMRGFITSTEESVKDDLLKIRNSLPIKTFINGKDGGALPSFFYFCENIKYAPNVSIIPSSLRSVRASECFYPTRGI